MRELILSLLEGEPPVLQNNVSESSGFCGFKGKEAVWKSPVEVHIYDEQGRHTGPIENNGIEYGIPGVMYEIVNGEKFTFLPTDEGQIYRIEATGEDVGTFDLWISDIDNGDVLETNVFNDVPITESSVISLEVSELSTDTEINVDGQEIMLDATLDPEQSEDLTPPVTDISLDGVVGNNGWYRSDVTVSLTATDDLSGVLETRYSIDGGATFTPYAGAVSVQGNGVQNIQYYSVDRAGNNEEVKTLEIKIDKIAPEFSVEFDVVNDRFILEAKDENPVTQSCSISSCTAEDEAGNKSVLSFETHSKKNRDTLELKSIDYGPTHSVFPESSFIVEYKEKNDVLKDFDQVVVIKKQERARINYQKKKNQSIIIVKEKGHEKNKKIEEGMKFLQLLTNQAMLDINIK